MLTQIYGSQEGGKYMQRTGKWKKSLCVSSQADDYIHHCVWVHAQW